MARSSPPDVPLDTELADLPPDLRWRTWMGRVEAVIFAAAEPVGREALARVVGRACNLDALIADIQAELGARPYELVAVAGGWHHRTRPGYGAAIRAAGGARIEEALGATDLLVLMGIAYFQPITRAALGDCFGKAVSRDTIARLRARGFVAAGPRSPQPGAPYTYVTTKAFLAHYGFETLRDLPDMEALEEAGLLGRDRPLPGDLLPILEPDAEE